jgi:uracil-DNA glycosylase
MRRNLNTLYSQVPEEWHGLTTELSRVTFPGLQEALDQDADKYTGLGVYPPPEDTFRAFLSMKPTQVKVVIIGQDCYHQPGQAVGLCFGVRSGIKIPPSLNNIRRELMSDTGIDLTNTELSHWAGQGVLMLNSALTVRQSCPGSHLTHWKHFTVGIIKILSSQTENLVFLLWGRYAKGKEPLIASNRGHHILKANHPSPLSANRGGWFGTRHFSQTNQFLEANGKSSIKW